MSKHPVMSRARAASPKAGEVGGSRRLLLAWLAALCVARPLLASEAVSWLGDGQTFNMLWLVLALLTALAAVGQGGLRIHWTATDFAAALLVACSMLSAAWGMKHASPRPAINMFWEWMGMALVYFLIRELIRTAAERRALVAVMIALAVALSCDGYYQYFVSLPADRAAYAADADAMLRSQAQWFAAGSVEREQFEHRLSSAEPLATFALTNSLAGVLAPWLIVAVGLAANLWASAAKGSRDGLAALVVSTLVIAGCLILTKSRSAYIALLVGLALLPLALAAVRSRLRWPLVAGAAGAATLLLAIAFGLGKVDPRVFTDASKSLGYRVEYWKSTWNMIVDHPWLGCGPGNFQDAYMRYKLPEASEEIQDPHNLFLEVWANSGTLAFAALVALLACFAWQMGRGGREVDSIATKQQRHHQPAATGWPSWIAAGAAIGPFLAFGIGPLVSLDFGLPLALGGLIVGAAVWFGLKAWTLDGILPAALLPLAALVLVVHLLASGGITFPGVAYSLWILLALAVSEKPDTQAAENLSRATRTPWGAIGASAAAGVAATACYLTAYAPVLESTSAGYRIEYESERRDWQRYEMAVLHSAAADPLSSRNWQRVAEMDFEVLRRRADAQAARERFERSVERMVELRPQSSPLCRQAGNWFLRMFDETGSTHDAELAIDYLQRAVQLYPSSAAAHADYAVGLAEVGRPRMAVDEARQAIELDDSMPHADKRLPAATRENLNELPRQILGESTH